MPKTETIIRVFLASPSDVIEEREVLDDIIKELNDVWSEHLGIRLHLVKWETQCHPDAGTDSQAVINAQIGDDYQVFIGILWLKFGTPTPRAGSGTVEEFERAYAKFKLDPSSINIMFYFNIALPLTLDGIDPEQLVLVRDFERRLAKDGLLYNRYSTEGQFETSVRTHLSRIMQDWNKKGKSEKTIVSTGSNCLSKKKPDEYAEDDEYGLIDSIELGQESFEDANEIVRRMADAIIAVGQKMSERTKELDSAKTPTGSNDIKITKRTIDRAAKDMEEFAVRMDVEIPLFSKSYFTGIEAYGRAISIYSDLNKEELPAILESIRSLRTSIEESREKVVNFRDILAKLPKITKAFNKSKRHVVSILDHFLRDLLAASNLAFDMEMIIERSLEGPSIDGVAPKE